MISFWLLSLQTCILYEIGTTKKKTLTTGWLSMKGQPKSGWANCLTGNPSTWSMEHTILKLSASPTVSSGDDLPLATSKVQNRSKWIHISNCLAEVPSKTATGTIAIQVEDFNDHCPTLTSTTHTMCFQDNFIYVTAIDQDEFPNSAPFDFTVVEGSWNVEPYNGKIFCVSC